MEGEKAPETAKAVELWTRDFALVTVANFLTYMIFYLIMAIIARYAVERFQASTGMAGFVSGIFLIGILVGRLGTGRIVEEVGSKRVLVGGAFLHVIASGLYLCASTVPVLAIVRFFHGVAFGIAHTGAGTIAAQVIPRGRQGEGIGFYTMSQIAATAFGPFLGITIGRYVDFGYIFFVALLIGAGSLLVSSIITQPPSVNPKRLKVRRGLKLSDFIEFAAVPISVIILIAGFIYFSILTFMPLYSREIHLEGWAGVFFLVYAITVVMSRPVSGRLLDVKGANFVVYPCLLLFALGMVLLAHAKSGMVLLLAAIGIGLGYGNLFSCGHAIAIKSVPQGRVGLATATYYIFIDIGSGIGPYVFGSLLSFMGYGSLFEVLAILVLATLGAYRLFYREHRADSP